MRRVLREQMVAKYEPLVQATVRRIACRRPDLWDDLLQEGRMQLWRLSATWDPKRGRSWGVYAKTGLNWHVLAVYKEMLTTAGVATGESGRRASLQEIHEREPVDIDGLPLHMLPTANSDPEEEAGVVEDRRRVWAAYRYLSPREKVIFTRRLLSEDPATLASLRRKMPRETSKQTTRSRLTRERVRQIELRTIRRLKEVLR